MSNTARVLFFATFRERAGVKETTLEFPVGTRVREFRGLLAGSFPVLAASIGAALVSVNHEYAFDEDVVPDQAEVAVFPAVSGGSDDQPTVIAIVEQAFDLGGLLAQITLPGTGAACFFTGMVRAVTQRDDPHQTTYLEYEAYRPMAEAKMRQIAEEMRQRWPDLQGIAMVQRVGRLDAGTPTVVVACSAAHRDTGVFAAARHGIDRLKEIVPVWKKEVGPNGETWVEGSYIPRPGE
jgi:molybdopterin synthase catalytic subunit